MLADFGNELIHYGADRVVTVENDKLKHYTSDGYAQAFLAVLMKKIQKALYLDIQHLVKIYHQKLQRN